MVSALDLVRDGQLQDRARRAALLVGSFGVWTVLVWLGRIRNIAVDDDLSGGGRAWRLLLAAVFVAGATDVLVRLWRSWDRIRLRRARSGTERVEVPRRLLRSVALLAVFTIVVWGVRLVTTNLGDFSGGFKVVHTLLGLASIALAVAAWQAVAPRSTAASRHR